MPICLDLASTVELFRGHVLAFASWPFGNETRISPWIGEGISLQFAARLFPISIQSPVEPPQGVCEIGMISRYAFPLIAIAGCWGCASTAPPRLLHPGTAEYQQNRAERFDPYPLNDTGPYIGGGRPLQYDIPAPENERVQNETSFEERYHQAPPPGIFRPGRTSTTQPIIVPAPISTVGPQ